MLLAAFLSLFVFVRAQDEATVRFRENLLNRANQNGLKYQFAPNANEYRSSSPIEKYHKSYDFVVIGAGVAGTVAANRLSEVSEWNVLLLEAGVFGDNLTDIPGAYTPVYFTDYNWGFNSTPQTTACQGMEKKICHFPRGRGVGGSSLINGMVCARGYKYDYDSWGKIAGSDRWSFHNVLPYLKKSEDFVRNQDAPYEPSYHGQGGYLTVEYQKRRSPIVNTFLRANEELGYKIVDYNANKVGASISQQYTKNGHRVDHGRAFIRSIQDRLNLDVLTGSYVTRIKINRCQKRARGVEFTYNGRNYYVEVKKEVILSAGALQSPQILMNSGIGHKRHLRNFGIDVVQDLAVGDNLRDNAAYYGLTFSTNYTETATLREQLKEFQKSRGPLTSAGTQALGFYEVKRTKGTGIPEIELEFIPQRALNELSQRYFLLTDQTYNDLWKYNDPDRTFIMHVNGMHARSNGTVRLKSSDPFDYPSVNPRFLSDPDNVDIDTMYEGIQIALNLTRTKAFRAIGTKLQGGPLKACANYKYLTKMYWYCSLRQLTINLYHPSGTCSMGTDPRQGAVVDSELKVFGVKGLRVADVSVMPLSIAGHTHAPAAMIGEQLGDLVKSTYQHEQSSGVFEFFK